MLGCIPLSLNQLFALLISVFNFARLVILKLREIVVVVHQFSKLKRVLFQKRSIFHFPLLGFLEAGLSFWKIAFEIGTHTKNVRFFVIFKGSGIVLILSQTSSF